MLGVVLWSDQSDQKAIIWCEDHGNLAFIPSEDLNESENLTLDAGDVIQFELRDSAEIRIARNPRIVEPGSYPSLAEMIRRALPKGAKGAVDAAAQIIRFDPAMRRAG